VQLRGGSRRSLLGAIAHVAEAQIGRLNEFPVRNGPSGEALADSPQRFDRHLTQLVDDLVVHGLVHVGAEGRHVGAEHVAADDHADPLLGPAEGLGHLDIVEVRVGQHEGGHGLVALA
jgi:hypothetical protein